MKRIACALGFFMVVVLLAGIAAGAVPVYPGAKLEDTYEIKQPDVGGKTSKPHKIIVFTTNDFFENVVAFYRGAAREYRMPGKGGSYPKLPSGQELKEAYFIFDNASDIMSSKHWVKIQRPYQGAAQAGVGFRSGKPEGSREVTGIIEQDKRSYP
jgi:hypothetical protein